MAILLHGKVRLEGDITWRIQPVWCAPAQWKTSNTQLPLDDNPMS